MIRAISSATLLSFFALLAPCYAKAADEQESLALLVSALEDTADKSIQSALMRGMLSGLSGRRNVSAPAGWSELAEQFGSSSDKTVRELSSQLSQVFGDEAATKRALATLQNKSAETQDRRRALYALLTQKDERVSPILEQLLSEPEMTLDAIRGFAAIGNARGPELLLKRYRTWEVDQRKAVLETLATRKSYAESLLSAVRAGSVPKQEVPAHVVRSLSLIHGKMASEVFGQVRGLARERTKLMDKYKKLLTPAALADADAGKGRAVFQKTCASCHVLYGTGAKIGPDLTGSNRANLDYILLNSVDPSYDVPEGYRVIVIQTVDGRVLNGVLAEEDSQRVVLKTVEQPTVVILKSDIEDRRVSPKSMMPDGQLEQMKPQEVINLIKYLQTTEQVELDNG